MNVIKQYRFAVPAGAVRNAEGNTYNCTHMECKVYYSKGGMNFFTYKQEPRGYYMSVTPVTVGEYFVESVGFSGMKKAILPCDRQCKSKAAEAERIFNAEIETFVQSVYPGCEVDFGRKAA